MPAGCPGGISPPTTPLEILFNTAVQNSVGNPETTLISCLLRTQLPPCTGQSAGLRRASRTSGVLNLKSPARQTPARTRPYHLTRTRAGTDPLWKSVGERTKNRKIRSCCRQPPPSFVSSEKISSTSAGAASNWKKRLITGRSTSAGKSVSTWGLQPADSPIVCLQRAPLV